MAVSTKAGLFGPAALPVWRLMAVSAVALTTANCAQNPQTLAGKPGSSYDAKYGVKASPRLYNEGDVIPKGGGRRFSGKPYVVAGRTYVPRENARGYVREGLASWYGAAFHGRMTANGEVFDRHSIAAAHPTLPLPSYVRVTNLTNRRSMIVRVNDRGPYHAERLMDVSEEVAQALEFHNRGTTKVRVEYVGKASTAGSDDRKLLATLRTDGEPASVRGSGPVMMADLGPDTAPSDQLARAGRPALAFKPEVEAEAASATSEEAAPAPRPARPAPILVASASVAVPPALQPTAAPAEPFRPRPPIAAEAGAHRVALAAARPAREAEPLALAPPPLRLAHAGSERPGPAAVSGLNPGLQNHPQRLARAVPAQMMPAQAAGKTTAGKIGTGKTIAGKTLPPAAPAVAGRTLVAAKMPARSGAAPVAEARTKAAPMPVRMASAAGPTAKSSPISGPPAVRSAVAHPAGAVAAASKTVATKLAAAPGKPAKPALVVAGSRSGSRRAQVAEAN